MNIETLEAEMLVEVEAIDSFLNKENVTWREIRGVLNILKNRNREHYSKLKRKLFMDFRMITDHQISDPLLDPHLNRAYEIAGIFESGSV
jgi:cobalamin biosynthesis protein CbiG